MSRAEPLEALPILCGSCGAPAVLDEAPSIRCRHCGAHEPLPADERRRHEILDERFRDAVRRDLALRGLVGAYARTFDGRPLRRWVLPALLVGVILSAAVARTSTRPLVVVPALVTSVCLALLAALSASRRVARRSYAHHVRPHLLAIAPSAPGEPFACRVCGAPLASAPMAHRVCRHCASTSIVPEPAFVRELSRAHALATDRTTETRLALAGARAVTRASQRALAVSVALGLLVLGATLLFARP